MISEKTLALALARKVLTASQAESLRGIEAELGSSRLDAPDEEKLRFISGFGDIFVSIGLVLFVGAITYFGDRLVDGRTGGPIAVAIASWLLAEFFTRRRRMALPSILLLVAFCFSVFLATLYLIAPEAHLSNVFSPNTMGYYRVGPGAAIFSGAAMAAGALIHYARFQVPITVAAGIAGLVAIIAGLLRAANAELYGTTLHPALFLCGLAIFALAMRFDIADPLRQTRRTDIAFWLHLLAAPLIVHSALSNVWSSSAIGAQSAFAMLAIFIALAAVAVLVNRRAILVSGLAYAGFAFGALIDTFGFSDNATPLTFLTLGALVLLLSAGWGALRTRILRLVPERWRTMLPPDLATPT